MSIIKKIKTTLIHVVCIVMLVLIQFDVCGYDLLRACHLADKPTPDYATATDLSLNDGDDDVSAWANPVYRGVNPRSLIKAPLVDFSVFSFHSFQRELPMLHHFAHYFQAKLLNLTYLRFCVFRI